MNQIVALLLSVYYIFEGIVLFFVPRVLRYKKLDNDVVLVTGGASGIGRALAIEFAKRNVRKVVLWDLSSDGLKESAALVEAEGAKCWTYQVDVSDRAQVYKVGESVRRDLGQNVSILVNNAGVVSGAKLLDIPDEKIIRSFNVNALAHFWTLKTFLPGMIADKRGHLVSIASLAGIMGGPRLSDYCASKFAAVGLEESVRLELQSDEDTKCIKSTVVCPYYINTGMFKGVDPGGIAMLEPDFVVREIMSAVMTDQPIVYIPRLFYFLTFLKAIYPFKSYWLVAHDVVRGTQCMDTFVGRVPEAVKKNE